MKKTLLIFFAFLFITKAFANFNDLEESNKESRAFALSLQGDFTVLKQDTATDTQKEGALKKLLSAMCSNKPTRPATKEDYAFGFALTEALADYCLSSSKNMDIFFASYSTSNATVLKSWTQTAQTSSQSLKTHIFGTSTYNPNNSFLTGLMQWVESLIKRRNENSQIISPSTHWSFRFPLSSSGEFLLTSFTQSKATVTFQNKHMPVKTVELSGDHTIQNLHKIIGDEHTWIPDNLLKSIIR